MNTVHVIACYCFPHDVILDDFHNIYTTFNFKLTTKADIFKAIITFKRPYLLVLILQSDLSRPIYG